MKINILEKNLYTLIDALIDCDFLALQTVKPRGYKITTAVNPYEAVKNIKELMCIISSLSKSNSFDIVLYCEDKGLVRYLKFLIAEESLNLKNLIITDNCKDIFSSNSNSIFLILGEYNRQLIKRLDAGQFYSIYTIAIKDSNYIRGSYHMFNDVNNFKKLVFFLAVLSQIINNTYDEKKI